MSFTDRVESDGLEPNAGRHEAFEELCALYTAGGLTNDQVKQLDEHLEGCLACRRALQEFQEITSMGLPALAPEFAALPEHQNTLWSPDRVQARLLARIQNEVLARLPRPADSSGSTSTGRLDANAIRRIRALRRLTPYAAAVTLVVVASGVAYRLGSRTTNRTSAPQLQGAQSIIESQHRELDRFGRDREALRLKLQAGDSRIAALLSEAAQRATEISTLRERLKEEHARLAGLSEAAEAKRLESEAEQAAMSQRLADAHAALDSVQRRLDVADGERAADLQQVAALERRVNEASAALTERDQRIQEQRDLLAHDRDIRDLIGARDLYVAEVTDVGRDGATQKPFGRVFFTKSKSLVFYAYDLDRQPGLRAASAFQAWGRRGPDFTSSLPLGIMYLDSASNKRWALKFDDPKALASIDAVFVTVEPKGGSAAPSGKPLLFAYLRVEPNHP